MKNKLGKINTQKLIGIVAFCFFAWFILAWLILPNLNTIWTVFVQDGQITLEPVQKLLRSERAMNSLRNSFILAPCLAVTVGIVGTSLVLITEYFDVKGSKILRLGYMTTLIYGGIILVSGYIFIYGKNGFLTNALAKVFPSMPIDWFQGFWAVLFVMTFSCTSNHMIFLRNAMRSVDFQTVEAAQNMGASQWTVLRKVVLPVLTPSLIAVTILTFLTGLSATSAPMLVGGRDFQTITPMIIAFCNSASSRDLATLLSLILGIATIIILMIMKKLEKRGYYMSISKVKTKIVKQKIRNPIVNILVHIYAYVLFLIYVIPVVLIILFSFMDVASIAKRELNFSNFTLANYITVLTQETAYKPFVVSIVYSFLAALGVCLLILLACRTMQRAPKKLGEVLDYSLLIPWLLPTSLIAIGLIVTYNQPRFWVLNQILIGTPIIMLIGYIINKIPFTLRMIKASFRSLDNSLEDAARNLGSGPMRTFFTVMLPNIMPTILAVFALDFNGLLGDYEMSVMLYNPVYVPLGVTIKNLTQSTGSADNTALTFVYAVIKMIIATIVVYLVYGRGSKSKLAGEVETSS